MSDEKYGVIEECKTGIVERDLSNGYEWAEYHQLCRAKWGWYVVESLSTLNRIPHASTDHGENEAAARAHYERLRARAAGKPCEEL